MVQAAVADDVFYALANTTRRKVLEQLARNGMTMLLVTHEMGFARNVGTRVIFMHRGKIWEQGPPAQVLGSPQTPEMKSFLGSVLH